MENQATIGKVQVLRMGHIHTGKSFQRSWNLIFVLILCLPLFSGSNYGLPTQSRGGQPGGMYMNMNGDNYQGGDNSVGANVQSQVGVGLHVACVVGPPSPGTLFVFLCLQD